MRVNAPYWCAGRIRTGRLPSTAPPRGVEAGIDARTGTVALSANLSGAVGFVPGPWLNEAVGMKRRRIIRPIQPPVSGFAGFRFPPEVILIAVRWYLRYGLSYRDLEELLAERGIEVDHVTLFRWVQRFTPLLIDAARPCRHSVGGHWYVDETYVTTTSTGSGPSTKSLGSGDSPWRRWPSPGPFGTVESRPC